MNTEAVFEYSLLDDYMRHQSAIRSKPSRASR
jgi:hypothetical protein